MPLGIETTTAILDAMVEGVIVVNAYGKLVLANAAARTMLNWPWPAAAQHYVEVVRQPDIVAQFEAALSGSARQPVDVEIDREGGRSIFTAHAVPVAAAQGGGAVLVLRDITDMRRVDQTRRDFVTNVSHELRTPLTAIRGYLEALRETPTPPPAMRAKFLEIIERHAGRMERLVHDLLRLARLDARQDRLDPTAITTAGLVASVSNDLDATLAAKRQRIALDVESGAEMLTADQARLGDALRNVVENASNYGPVGSAVEIHAARQAGVVSLAIADRGPGIPEADLPRIFERFYRVDRSRSVDPGGTGLGLSIARHAVELHGGRITAANRPGGGAVVTITLPCPESTAQVAI